MHGRETPPSSRVWRQRGRGMEGEPATEGIKRVGGGVEVKGHYQPREGVKNCKSHLGFTPFQTLEAVV